MDLPPFWRRPLRIGVVWGVIVAIGAAGLAGADERPWAFQPVERPEVPGIEGLEIQNPIDAFLLRSMAEYGLEPAPGADRRTLIRRVTFDLIGLPPTPEEVEAFLNDSQPDAYERLVDRLLASPQYGERWARHWLDLVRFAETHGYERDDPKPGAWRYRDWVIQALNDDKPYDRFLIEQLAGDELPDADFDTRIATGMLQLGLVDDEPADPVMDRFDQLDDQIRTVSTTMLGLTIHCARCHDHKFDPISQEDYYRFLAFFQPAKMFVRGNPDSISFELVSSEEKAQHDAELQRINAEIEQRRAAIETLRAVRKQGILDERRRGLDNDTLAALQTPAERRDDSQNRLIAQAGSAAEEPSPQEIDESLSEEAQAQRSDLQRQIRRLERSRPAPLARALTLTDQSAEAEPTHLLIRGDAHAPGNEVDPGFLSILNPEPLEIEPPANSQTTGRRLALARWIANPENPLTARVLVNRLWQYHFGQGLVGTSSDFGAMGEEPTDPELLDWLASEFIANGWSLKAMHKLMLTSAAYQRSNRWDENAYEADPGNWFHWRMAPRRLEAEPIRDAILAVTGTLNLEMGGPSARPPLEEAVLATQSVPGKDWNVSEPDQANRRSVYLYVKRTLAVPELEVLDAPDASEPCPERPVTTTALQALTLINGGLLHEQAGHFADRLAHEAGPDPAVQVEHAFRLALARNPTADELGQALDFLASQAELIQRRPDPDDRANPEHEALRAFCLVLLNTNEFVTVD